MSRSEETERGSAGGGKVCLEILQNLHSKAFVDICEWAVSIIRASLFNY